MNFESFFFFFFFEEKYFKEYYYGACKSATTSKKISGGTDYIQTVNGKDKKTLLAKACAIALPSLSVREKEKF